MKKLFNNHAPYRVKVYTMSYEPIKLFPRSRWEVIFQDHGSWRSGIYKPESRDPAEITELEKHTCPELFICMNGSAGLLIRDGAREHAVSFKPGESLLVSEYHNGFLVDENGYFLVIERTSFTTSYMDRRTGKITRTVDV